jgi:hypothetical protein
MMGQSLVALTWDDEPVDPSDFDLLPDEDKTFYWRNTVGQNDSTTASSFALAHATETYAPRSRTLSTWELLHRPEPVWTVEGLIPWNGFVVLVGRHGVGKTFLAFDLAAHMSLGRSWFGRATQATKVLYVALEGFDSARVRAWQDHHQTDSLPDLEWRLDGINLKSRAEQDALIAAVRESDAKFVVLDTLNRSVASFDENSSADMGLVIRFADRLRIEADAGLIVVHHSPRDGSNPRGHSSLEGAVDTVLNITAKNKNQYLLRVTKQRNSPSGETVKFRITAHAATGGAVVTAIGPTRELDQLKRNERRLVQFLVQDPVVVPGTHGDLMKRAVTENEMGKSSFNAALKGLVDQEILDRQDDGKGSLYDWTSTGQEVIRRVQG